MSCNLALTKLTRKAQLTQMRTRNSVWKPSKTKSKFTHPSKQPCFFYSRRRAPNDRRLIIYSVLLVLTRGRDLSRSANTVSAGNRKISLPFSFSALVRSDTLQMYGKALRFLKLESSRQPRWRYGDSSLHRFWLIHPFDRQTDGRTELRWLRRATAIAALA